MVIMAVVAIMMMTNLVVLKIRLISGIKLDNDGKRIASYNQVFSCIERFSSSSTFLTILQQFLQFLHNSYNSSTTMARLLGGKGEDMVAAEEADEDEGSSICL